MRSQRELWHTTGGGGGDIGGEKVGGAGVAFDIFCEPLASGRVIVHSKAALRTRTGPDLGLSLHAYWRVSLRDVCVSPCGVV